MFVNLELESVTPIIFKHFCTGKKISSEVKFKMLSGFVPTVRVFLSTSRGLLEALNPR